MLSAWHLPEHMADVLPAQARRIEELRRSLLDKARSYGFELVVPPMLEHLESLLSGTGEALDLQTFKLVDQLSGRTLGLRADTTPQAARIDAHLLNRDGITRLCYCGPVVHTRPAGAASTREPLQFGAEIFGHAGLEADLDTAQLALDALLENCSGPLVVDLADARLLRGLLAGMALDAVKLQAIVEALSEKDAASVARLTESLPRDASQALQLLMRLYGGDEVILLAQERLPDRALVRQSLQELQWLAAHLRSAYPDLKVGFDLADMSGYAYYSGLRFTVFAGGGNSSLARGGRYDEVGSVFGRNRPAVGFSLDLKALAEVAGPGHLPTAVLAPWGEDEGLRLAVRRLRAAGEIVVCAPAGQCPQVQAFEFDRELLQVQGRWVLQATSDAVAHLRAESSSLSPA